MGLLPSPEQSAGEGRQRRIEAHQVQALQLSLGRQQPIERIPVGLPVATGVEGDSWWRAPSRRQRSQRSWQLDR